jgi:hypothetical protein
VTWQVTRAEFDHLLINHAADQGVVRCIRVCSSKKCFLKDDRAVGVEVADAGRHAAEKFLCEGEVDARPGQARDALEQVSVARARSED